MVNSVDMTRTRAKYALTTDCVIFGYSEGDLQVALIKRKNPPFAGAWALPGGFVEEDETVEECAYRELAEETNIKEVYLEQFHVYSALKRDPRGRVITVAFVALVARESATLVATEDAAEVVWWPAYKLPKLAFDHREIFEGALEHLRIMVEIKPVVFKLLPKKFTLTALQDLYEALFNERFDKRNFRKKILKLPYVVATGEYTEAGKHRPAQLYTFQGDDFE